jgi:hypothetical protein
MLLDATPRSSTGLAGSPAADEHDGERVVAGIALGCLLSLPLWVGLAALVGSLAR